MTATEHQHGFRLGPWKVEPLRGAVTGPDGAARHLEPKVMDVFVCLAEHPNELVTRQHLQDVVWRGLAVTDEPLTRAVGELRRALQSGDADTQYIETVPKRGYRLVGDILPLDATRPDNRQDSFAGDSNQHFTRAAVLVALATIVFALVYWSLDSLKDQRNPVSQVSSGVSIAVLPIENLSGEIANEYFAEGLAEEIRSLLANVPGLKVIGRSSSNAFDGSNVDLREIGQRLGVSKLLEGSVRRSGDTLRVTLQLVDAADGSSMWAYTYERPMTDIFEVQDEIATAVISKIAGSASLQPDRRLPTENIEAYALYVEARGLLGKYSLANVRAAEQRLLRAVELDPHFARAYEQLAFVYWEQSGVVVTSSEAEILQRNAAADAIRLDPDLAFARFLLADVTASTPLSELLEDLTVLVQTGQHQSFALGTLTWYLIYVGYSREALAVAERYLQHDPYSAGSHRHVAYALLANGRQREAIEALEIAARLEGGLNSLLLAQLQYGLRRDKESIAAFADAWRENGVDVESLPEVLAHAARSDTGQEYLDSHVPAILSRAPDENVLIVRKHLYALYLQFGYVDRFYELIEALGLGPFAGHVEHTWMGMMLRDSGFTAHPGYLKIAESVKLPELWDSLGSPDMCEKRNSAWVCD